MSDPILGRIEFGQRMPERHVDWVALLQKNNLVFRMTTDRGHSDDLLPSPPMPEGTVEVPVKRWFAPLSGAEVHDEAVSP